MNFKFIKKPFRFLNCFSKEGGVDILKEWKLIFGFFFFLLVGILVIDGYIFWKCQIELAKNLEAGPTQSLTIDKETLQEVMNLIKMKEAKFNQNLVPSSIKDPSL